MLCSSSHQAPSKQTDYNAEYWSVYLVINYISCTCTAAVCIVSYILYSGNALIPSFIQHENTPASCHDFDTICACGYTFTRCIQSRWTKVSNLCHFIFAYSLFLAMTWKHCLFFPITILTRMIYIKVMIYCLLLF